MNRLPKLKASLLRFTRPPAGAGVGHNGKSQRLGLLRTHVAAIQIKRRPNAETDELVALADEKATPFWKAIGTMNQGWLFAQNGKFADAVQMFTSGIVAYRSTGARMWLPLYLSYLAKAHAELGQFDDAWHRVGEAMTEIETTKERWQEAEVHRVAGEIALMSPGAGTAKAEAYFNHALAVARSQQARSWELRTALSMARLWRDLGKPQQARELLAPVYGWFTEGFETRDLKEATAMLDQLAS